jgi:hypothetical protein
MLQANIRGAVLAPRRAIQNYRLPSAHGTAKG